LTGIKTDKPWIDSLAAVKFAPPVFHHRSVWSIDRLSQADLLALLDTAARLKQSARAGHPSMPLRGKHLALLCKGGACDGDHRVVQAARDLGAKVACLRTGDTQLDGSAQLLGRLYDAIDCEDMDRALVDRLDRDAGIPVFNGLDAEDHATGVIAELLSMQEHGARPLAGLAVCFVGDPGTPRGKAMLRAAALAGMELRIATPRDATAATEFVIEAQSDGRWTLTGRDGRIDDAERLHNRRYTVQAVLVQTLA
jgi:ornithine carbamoyltransferase